MMVLRERPRAAQPQLSDALFEGIAQLTLREDVRLEFRNGTMGEKPAPDGDHAPIFAGRTRSCLQSRPELRLYPE